MTNATELSVQMESTTATGRSRTRPKGVMIKIATRPDTALGAGQRPLAISPAANTRRAALIAGNATPNRARQLVITPA